jgi:hypothetical protein
LIQQTTIFSPWFKTSTPANQSKQLTSSGLKPPGLKPPCISQSNRFFILRACSPLCDENLSQTCINASQTCINLSQTCINFSFFCRLVHHHQCPESNEPGLQSLIGAKRQSRRLTRKNISRNLPFLNKKLKFLPQLILGQPQKHRHFLPNNPNFLLCKP